MTGRSLLGAVTGAQRRPLMAGAALLGVHQAFEAMVPVIVGVALDAAVAESDAGALVLWLALLAGAFVGLSLAYRFGSRLAEGTTERAAHRLRLQLVERVVDPRGGGDAGRAPGELLSIATADVDATADIVRVIVYGTGLLIALVTGAVVLLLTSLTLGLIVLIGLPLVVWLGGRIGIALTRRASDQQATAAVASGVATDMVSGLRVLHGIGGNRAGAARYRKASRTSLRATLGAARTEAAFDAGSVLVGALALAAVALVGGRMAASGELSIGELVAAAGVTQFLVGPLSTLGWAAATIARAQASAARLAVVLSAPSVVPAPAMPTQLDAGRDALAFRELSIGPLDGLDLEIAPGQLCGLALEDPAAADALLSCLSREREPESGGVFVGEVPFAQLDPATARAAVVISPHDAALLADSVLANISAAADGDQDATERALTAAAVDDVVAALPRGYEEHLGDAGRSLSGGQRQRIALARALAAPAPILVLHEPTTSLDSATEARVAAGLRAVREGRTTLLVTTSPALLAVCDVVALVSAGRITASGTHADLLDDHGYRAAVLA